MFDSPVSPMTHFPVSSNHGATPEADGSSAGRLLVLEVSRRIRGAIVRLAGAVARARYRVRAARLERLAREHGDDLVTLSTLVDLHAANGALGPARDACHRMAVVYRTKREVDGLAYCRRKLLRLGDVEPVGLLREMVILYADAKRFTDAAQAAQALVTQYVAEGQRPAALGFVRSLPKLGPIDAETRVALEALASPRAAAGFPRTGDTAYVEGELGVTRPLEAVEIAERNRVTGRLVIRSQSVEGEIVFREGRIASARAGASNGQEALKQLLLVDAGTYAIYSEQAPESSDEFRAPSNTGLLVSVLRLIEEERETRSERYTTQPLR